MADSNYQLLLQIETMVVDSLHTTAPYLPPDKEASRPGFSVCHWNSPEQAYLTLSPVSALLSFRPRTTHPSLPIHTSQHRICPLCSPAETTTEFLHLMSLRPNKSSFGLDTPPHQDAQVGRVSGLPSHAA
ncbi:hypothetical protein BASA60_006291 [Batrachochytrium salamandrivorans]|nr:hypothetical protein BASA60_006291 [Batrachochytrium salamandrivorans]